MSEEKVVWKGDKEFWIGETRIHLEGNNIIVNTAGEIDEKMAAIAKENMIKLGNMVKGKVNHLIDLNRAGEQSMEVRKIWKELSEHEKTGKVALYGMHPVTRVIGSFVMGITGKKDFLFFKTKEEALAWLKE